MAGIALKRSIQACLHECHFSLQFNVCVAFAHNFSENRKERFCANFNFLNGLQ